jgi:2',3'-cyclic-nucleotide 2'-phosphodiesterase (5'-nucleotidase family)
LFFFDSGDIVEGTGLSDASSVHGERILPIVQQVPYDAITIGNHELYHSETVRALRDSGFIAGWHGRYLTANVLDASTG